MPGTPIYNHKWDQATGDWLKDRNIQNYLYMGTQATGGFTYYGFKQNGGTGWYIMRKNDSDNSDWAYAFSSSGGNSWTTAWGTPSDESYDDPPDS